MLQFTRSLMAVCALTVLSSAALAQELVDNPRYQAWAKFKLGTTVTLCNESNVGGMTFKTELKCELAELTVEKAVLETTLTTHLPPMPPGANMRVESPTKTKNEIPAKVKKEDVITPGAVPPGMKGETKVLADEDVTVVGKTYKCKVYQSKGEQDGATFTGKLWLCPQVPGELVKDETIVELRKDRPKTTGTTTLTAFEVK